MSYFHKHHLYGLLFRSSSSFNIIRLVLLGVFSFSPAMYSLQASIAVIAGLLLVAFIWDYYFYADYRPIELLSKFIKTVPNHVSSGESGEQQDAKDFLEKGSLSQDQKGQIQLDTFKKVALATDFLFIFGVLLSFYRGLQQCFHFSLSSNLLFYQIIAGLLVVSLILLYFRYRILKEEQFCLNKLIGAPQADKGEKNFKYNKHMLITTGLSLLAYVACQSFFIGASLLSSPHWLSLSLVCMIFVVAVCYSIDQHYSKNASYQGGLCEDIIANPKNEYANDRGSKLHMLWAFLLYGIFQISIPGVTLFGNPHWLSIAAAVTIFTFFMCHLHSFKARKTVQRWANWFINFSFFYYTSQVFSTLALQTTFGALISNPWGFLLLFLGGAIPATIVFINERVHEEEQLCIELLGAGSLEKRSIDRDVNLIYFEGMEKRTKRMKMSYSWDVIELYGMDYYYCEKERKLMISPSKKDIEQQNWFTSGSVPVTGSDFKGYFDVDSNGHFNLQYSFNGEIPQYIEPVNQNGSCR
ncbi:hypothetical protein N9Y17_01000 [Gammaproteobacteria bacterium]|nr:hypothetical protein [Gammaproteobacteria bacterium]